MKLFKLTFLLLCLLTVVISFGQKDSVLLQQLRWETKKVSKGIVLKQYAFRNNLFASNQYISVLEIRLGRKNRVNLAAEPALLKGTSQFAREHNAIAALNGTFFDMKNGGSMDYIRIDHQVVHQNRLGRGGTRALHQKAALVVDGRRVNIAGWDTTERWEDQLEAEDVMVSGPLLLINRTLARMDSTETYFTRHPRSAVAMKGKKLWLIAVDGRNQNAAGMSLFELQRFIYWLGAESAMNLDGGGSTTLWIRGSPDGGVVNHPSDNKKMENSAAYKPGTDLDNLPADEQKWDHSGERPVANVILITRK